MTDRLYADNAATSFPKPPAVWDAMRAYAEDLGASAGRGAYREALETGVLVTTCRRRLAKLINAEDANQVVFTHNGSAALNQAIKGLLRPGDRAGPLELGFGETREVLGLRLVALRERALGTLERGARLRELGGGVLRDRRIGSRLLVLALRRLEGEVARWAASGREGRQCDQAEAKESRSIGAEPGLGSR